jgi:hypothetical protein
MMSLPFFELGLLVKIGATEVPLCLPTWDSRFIERMSPFERTAL